MELVEGPADRIHGPVVLPGLRDHHEDGVGERAPAQVQQLEDLVEAGRVAGAGRDDREDPLEIAGEEVAGQEGLPGAHPVAVALEGVDLAVVRKVPVGVGEGPAREGVGGKAGVHQGQGRVRPLILKIREKGLDLRCGEHPLVDDGSRREGGEVGAG